MLLTTYTSNNTLRCELTGWLHTAHGKQPGASKQQLRRKRGPEDPGCERQMISRWLHTQAGFLSVHWGQPTAPLCRVAVTIRDKVQDNPGNASGVSEGPEEKLCHHPPALMGSSSPRHCFLKKPTWLSLSSAASTLAQLRAKLPEPLCTWPCSLDRPAPRTHQPLGTEEASREGYTERVHALEVDEIGFDSWLLDSESRFLHLKMGTDTTSLTGLSMTEDNDLAQ